MNAPTVELRQESFLRMPTGALALPHCAYPRNVAGVPQGVLTSGSYDVRFAHGLEDLRAVQRLRFDVFNLELSEGLSTSYETGLDEDAFDARCHHLMVIERKTATVVGTYRLMTRELAQRNELYTHTEFDLSGLPDQLLREGVEVGRACVAKAHRNGRVLQLLWRGIARYLDWNDKQFVFGCCSVPTLEPSKIAAISLELARRRHFHPSLYAPVRPAFCGVQTDKVILDESVSLPPLFLSYLRLGALVCGGPAVDREFGVTDYLVVLDLKNVDPLTLTSLRAAGLWASNGSD